MCQSASNWRAGQQAYAQRLRLPVYVVQPQPADLAASQTVDRKQHENGSVLFTPIAVSLAQGLGAPVEPFVVAVVFGANCAFATPMGYQTNLLVMGPAGYRFQDFVRAGLPMLLFVWATVSVVLPLYYDL